MTSNKKVLVENDTKHTRTQENQESVNRRTNQTSVYTILIVTLYIYNVSMTVKNTLPL